LADSVAGPSLTRRQALRAGALGVLLGAARLPSPADALAARPALFESDLSGEAAGGAGWRTTRVLRAPRRFDLVGLRWDAGGDVRAEVRARRRGGEWTDWMTLPVMGDHGPDEGSAPRGTDPAFTGAADEYQLRLLGRPRGLRARFVRALPTATLARRAGARLRRRARAARSGHRAQAVPTPFALITRSEWGADAVPPRTDPEYGDVQAAFVHHTVNANTYGPEDSAAIVLGIARYHRDSNGWNDIGYNFLVDRYGQIFEGRAGGIDQPVVGAHAQGYNSVSTGIACLGTFESVALTPAGMTALARVIGWKLSLHGVPVKGSVTVISAGGESNRHAAGTEVTLDRVSGHRDGDSTSCPGDTLYAQLPALRRKAAGYASPTTGLTVRAERTTARYATPVAFSGELRFADGTDAAGAPVSLEYQAAGSAWTPVASTSAAAGGEWAVTLEPPGSGLFRAAFAGDGSRPQVVSRPVRVDVLPLLSVHLDRRRMRPGRRVEITGTVDPAQRVQLVIERRVGSRWHTGTSRFVRVRGGRFGVTKRLKAAGRYRVTVIAGKTRRRRVLRVG
jgi:N-acetylmuramoyl-L-alanine amidase